MPPARRQIKALGSLQLVGYANNPTKVITELAFIADERAHGLAGSGQGDIDSPLEVQFNEFMDGVNSRGIGTKTRQRKMTVEQAAAVLLVTVQKGHVELIAKKNDPHTIDVIKILPGAKRILTSFLPKLRGYGDIPYDQQYRGAIALARRHFFPNGKPPTKKELMALLLQTYQEKRELDLQRQNRLQAGKTLGTQTSFIERLSSTGIASSGNALVAQTTVDTGTVEVPDQSNFQSSVEQPNVIFDDEFTILASDSDTDLDDNKVHNVFSTPDVGSFQLSTCAPVVPRFFNPYMTPVSNPRLTDHGAAVPSPPDASPTPAIDKHKECAPSECDGSADQDTRELLQATATSRGVLNYYYDKFATACQRITFLEGQKDEIEREFDLTKKRLDETEQRLQEADADRSRLRRWVDKLRRQVDSFCSQVGLLREMANSDPDGQGVTEFDPMC